MGFSKNSSQSELCKTWRFSFENVCKKKKLSLNIVVVVLFPKEPEYRPAFAPVYKSIVEFTGEDYDETVE